MKNKMKRCMLLCLVMAALLMSGCSAIGSSAKKDDAGESDNVNAYIEELAAEGIFNVFWYTQEDAYAAGTAFLMDSEVHGEKVLVTAFHFLWPEEAETFSGSELPEFVTGGELYYASDFGDTYATLKSCLIIEDADVAPAVDKDVAAFTLYGGEDLKTLPLASGTPEKGDKLYLLANLGDANDAPGKCVYEGQVISSGDGILYYKLSGSPKTSGASGAPIVNEKGEVLAIHIGSNPINYVGHTADSFLNQINNAKISDNVYPEQAVAEDHVSEPAEGSGPTEFVECMREDKVSTMFYDVQIEGVTLSDTLQGTECEEGYQFVVLDVSLQAAKDATEPIDMFSAEFAMEWPEDYCLALESGWTEEQFPDEFLLTGEQITGELVFVAPKDKESVLFSFYEMYIDEEANEWKYGKYYGMNVPLENWIR